MPAGRTSDGFSKAASKALLAFDWPGNVRQLQNEIQRAVLMREGNTIEETDLSFTRSASAKKVPDMSLIGAMERNAILQTLTDTNGNKSKRPSAWASPANAV